MKSKKILSLLFTLAQLIFFIKLIEYCVDGVESRSLTTSPTTTTISGASSQIPQDQQQQTNILNSQESRSLNRFFGINGGRTEKSTGTLKSSLDSQKNSTETEVDISGSRDCPACVNGECDSNITSFAFPFFQLKVGLFAILVWYILFLFVWKYPKHQPATKPTGGYGGYSAPMPTYGPPAVQGGYSSGGYSSSNSGDNASNFGGLLTNVFQALDKYSN